MSEAQKEAYLKNPNACPFCGSSEINSGEWDDEAQTRDVDCDECNEIWLEVFKMVDVHGEDE